MLSYLEIRTCNCKLSIIIATVLMRLLLLCIMWPPLVLVLLLTGQGFSQCFTGSNCTGDQVPAVSQKDCCVGTNTGLSYNDTWGCTVCIGM